MRYSMIFLIGLIVTLAVVFLNGCAPREYKTLTEQVANYGIQRFEDKDRGVICYVYRDADGNSMWCTKSVKN